jgi:RNA polymerase sigma-70 factor (ECF subfamily)
MSYTDSSLFTRPSLLVRVRDAGDNESWKTFVQTYGPLVYRYLRRQGLQDADAADVMQEVLADTARSLRTFEYRPERGRFRDWLWTLLRRKLARFYESQKRNIAGAGEGAAGALEQLESAQPGPEWTDEFHAQVLRVALERVRPDFEAPTWRAFELVWLENRPSDQTAAELGLPIDAIYVAKSRVLKRLREEVLMLAEDLPQFIPLG